MIEPEAISQTSTLDEVRTVFSLYEAALIAGDTAFLDGLFWNSPSTVRFGTADRQQGAEAIRKWRASQGPLVGRQLTDTKVISFGGDVAVVTTLFSYPDRAVEGRQSQTWIRLQNGWRIVAAHVSELPLSDG